MLYFNSDLKVYNFRNIIYFYQLLSSNRAKYTLKNLNFKFLFKLFFLENFPLFLKTSFYNNFFKKTFFYKKVNFLLVMFFIKTFIAQFKRILGVMFGLGFKNLNIFFLFLANTKVRFDYFYSTFYKKFFFSFKRFKKLYYFKSHYLNKFTFWSFARKFLRICKVKLLILWTTSTKPIFKRFLYYLSIPILSFDADITNFSISYSLGVSKFSEFQKIILSQFMLSSYIQGRRLFMFESQKGVLKKKKISRLGN